MLDGHRQLPIDSGEYVCECGWTPDWHGPPLVAQVLMHWEAAKALRRQHPCPDCPGTLKDWCCTNNAGNT